MAFSKETRYWPSRFGTPLRLKRPQCHLPCIFFFLPIISAINTDLQAQTIKEKSFSQKFIMLNSNLDRAPIGIQFGGLNKDGLDLYGAFRFSHLQLEHKQFDSNNLNIDTLLYQSVDSLNTRASLTLGITFPIKNVWLYTGIGLGASFEHKEYEAYNLNDPTFVPEPVWYRVKEESTIGVEYEIGAIAELMGAKISVGGASVNFKNWMLTLGVGITLPEPKSVAEELKKKAEEKGDELKKAGEGELENIKGDDS